MRLDLKIDTDFNYTDKEEKILELIFNLYKTNDIYIFFSWIGLILYKNLVNKNIKLNFYKDKIKNIYENINLNKNNFEELTFMKKIFNQISSEIKFILNNKIEFKKNNVIDKKNMNYYSSQEIIYDRIKKITYKNIKNNRNIYKYENYIIKEYIIYDLDDNYAIVSIINEIILNIYCYKLLKNYKNKKYIKVPKIHYLKVKKYKNMKDKLKFIIVMDYIDLDRVKVNKNYFKIYNRIYNFLNYIQKYKLYHNDTHLYNLIINNKKIILIDFGKSTLYSSFNPSTSGLPIINYIGHKNVKKQKKKIIILLMKKYQGLIDININKYISLIFKIY